MMGENMKTIKINYVDFWPNFKLEEDFIYELLMNSPDYEVEISDNPDYIVYSCFGYEHLKYDCIRIFFTGEELCPDFNICDYGIGFEYLSLDDRYFRLPLMYIPRYRKDYNLMMERLYCGQETREFCSFVYSNPKANPIRIDFFTELSKYKQIASGGKVLNNIGTLVQDKQKFEAKYKFSIAFENVRHRGYITEKLMQSFSAGGVPIYWGDPYVNRMFNSRAYINISVFKSTEDALENIKQIDQDDEAYKAMLQEAPLNDSYNLENVRRQFEIYLRNIFDQDLKEARRTTREMFNKRYVDSTRSKEKIYQMTAPIRKITCCVKTVCKTDK